MMPCVAFPSDLLPLLVRYLDVYSSNTEHRTLAALALVSHACLREASKALYSTAVIHSPISQLSSEHKQGPSRTVSKIAMMDLGKMERQLNLNSISEEEEEEDEDEDNEEEGDDRSSSSLVGYPRLASSILTRYRDFVTTIDIGGECIDNVQELDHAISVAILNYASLRRVVFAPPPSPTSSFHNPTFLRTRDVLLARASDIKELVLIPARAPWDGTTSHDVNGEVTVPWTACTKLETLSIANPSRAVLDVLPSWLRDLTSTLVEFHATGNCGSITPGVLTVLSVPLQNIRLVTLGLSYSLTHAHIFQFLANLPRLAELDLTYYYQFILPRRVPAFTTLRRVTLRFSLSTARAHASALCTFTRRLVAGSSLRSLTLLVEGEGRGWHRAPGVSHDAILEHVGHRHGSTLESLVAPLVFFGRNAVGVLVRKCAILSHLEVATTKEAILRIDKIIQLSSSLRILSLNKRNSTRRRVAFSQAHTEKILDSSGLMELEVDGVGWQRAWDMEQGRMVRGILKKHSDTKKDSLKS